jgi:hypothetical protein
MLCSSLTKGGHRGTGRGDAWCHEFNELGEDMCGSRACKVPCILVIRLAHHEFISAKLGPQFNKSRCFGISNSF